MKTRVLHIFILVALALSASLPTTASQAAQAAGTPSLLQFTAGGHALGFTPQGMYAATGSHALHVDFVGANKAQPQTDSPANTATVRQDQNGASLSNSGNSKVAPLNRVTYTDLWKGISLAYSADAGSIYTTTYTLTPGADPNNIRLLYNMPVTLNKNGTLTMAFETGKMTESAPIAWQDVYGKRVSVDVSFRVDGQEVSFAIGAYKPQYALTIDPSLIWNTFLGGDADDVGTSIAVGGSGNVYVTGYSGTSWQGTNPPIRPFTPGSTNAFVAKLNSNGALTWNTFLGGSGHHYGYGIAVDGSENVYVAGSSDATWGWSVVVPPVRAYTADYDAFATKLNSSGAVQWSTFLGGSGYDVGNAIAVDGSGNVYVAGSSNATWGWSMVIPPVRAYSAGDDTFATKLNSSGAVQWNTFLGGDSIDRGNAIAVDGSTPANVYVAGYSYATWQGTNPPVQAFSVGPEAFAAKMNSSGALTWNTFLGGSGDDRAYAMTSDGIGNVYVTGYSTTSWGSPVQAYNDFDAFAAKLNSSGGLTWNTFLGGTGIDQGAAIIVDGSGNVYVAGDSQATWGSPLQAYTAGFDAYAARLNNNGALLSNSFLGGSGGDIGYGLAVDGSMNVYVTGYSNATWGSSPVTAYAGGIYDAFVAKVDITPPSVVSIQRVNPNPTSASSVDFTVTFSESVSDVDMADFTLTTSGVTGATVTGVSGSGNVYTITISTGSNNGSIRLDVPGSATITDLAGSPLASLPYTSGDIYTVNKINQIYLPLILR